MNTKLNKRNLEETSLGIILQIDSFPYLKPSKLFVLRKVDSTEQCGLSTKHIRKHLNLFFIVIRIVPDLTETLAFCRNMVFVSVI